MVDDIIFQAFELQDWPWGGVSGSLYIFNLAQWTDQNGEVQLANPALDINEPRQKVEIVVDDRTPEVQEFTYQPTTLAIENPFVLRTGVVYDADDNEHYTLFRNCVFPPLPSPMNWREFIRYNSRPLRQRMSERYYTADQFLRIIAPRMISDNGTAEMVAGVVVVPSAKVTALSLIKPWSQSEGVSGVVRAVARNVGVDFTVISSNNLDEGEIAWEVTEPIPSGEQL